MGRLTNDRALAIGLLAALVTIGVHNLVDDLYDHSLTNLMALLLISLLTLGHMTAQTAQAAQQETPDTTGSEESAPLPVPAYSRIARRG